MFVFEFFVLLFEMIPLFFSITIFIPINKYKKLKTKEDQLFLQKNLITMIFFAIDIIFGFLRILNVGLPDILIIIVTFIFNIYIISILLYNLFLSLELYFTYSNPVHLFTRLFKQKNNNYLPEIIIVIISVIVLIFDIIIYFVFAETYGTKEIAVNGDTRLVMPNHFKCAIIILISLFSALICIRIESQIKKFSFKRQEKLHKLLNKRALGNMLYFLYGVLYAIPFLLKSEYLVGFNKICSFVVLALIIMDYLMHISILSSTKFCEYRLKKTIIGYICSFFWKPSSSEKETMIPLVGGDTIANDSDTTTGMGTTTSIQANETTVSELISNSPIDKELISIYKNDIFIEDYFLNFFDQILNVLTLSISKAYNSKHFSAKANDVRLSNDMDIDDNVSRIGGDTMSISVVGDQHLNYSKSQVGDNTATFEIKKNREQDDYLKYKEILESGIIIENDNNFLNIEVKSFFTPKCVETIFNQRLKGSNIGNSLISHIFLQNKNKIVAVDNPMTHYMSLTAANGKEEYFNKLKCACFKTFDKNFNLDIFESNDVELGIKENGKNDETSILIDKYFTYLQAKGINGTFIPSLVGVFKIKINNFKTLLVFVTRNSLVENAPKNFFTYWQLIRFLNDKPQKIASSQFSNGKGTLVKDDPIFEKLFQVETKKDNPDFNKINMRNFEEFQDTIKNDLSFLNNVGCQNFDLLLMYFEYETTQKHEKQGIIKIKKVNENEAEIIQASVPDDMLKEMNPSMNNNFRLPEGSMKSGMFSLGGAFLDGVEDDIGGTLDINLAKQNANNLMDYTEKINMNGFEGVFDSFNCLCFFTFENIFDLRKRKIPTDFYNNFQNKILDNFTSFKKK